MQRVDTRIQINGIHNPHPLPPTHAHTIIYTHNNKRDVFVQEDDLFDDNNVDDGDTGDYNFVGNNYSNKQNCFVKADGLSDDDNDFIAEDDENVEDDMTEDDRV